MTFNGGLERLGNEDAMLVHNNETVVMQAIGSWFVTF